MPDSDLKSEIWRPQFSEAGIFNFILLPTFELYTMFKFYGLFLKLFFLKKLFLNLSRLKKFKIFI